MLVVFCRSGLLRKEFQMLPTFSQNLTVLQEVVNEELKITEFDGALWKKFKLLIDRFSSFFR